MPTAILAALGTPIYILADGGGDLREYGDDPDQAQ